MPGVVNADQVQRAYTVPLEGIGNAVQYYDQLAIHKQQRQAAMADKKQAEDFKKATLLEKLFDGTDIGTGTPWDEVGHSQVASAKQRVIDYMKANPNANATDLWSIGTDATRGLVAGIDNAKKADTYVNEMVKRANTEYPHLDQTLLKAYYQNKAFRDDKGNVLATPNLNFYGNELQSPDFRANVANPEATAQGVSKELHEGFKPEPYAFQDEANPNIIIRGKTRAYQDHSGNPQLEPVAWHRPVEAQQMMAPLAAPQPGVVSGNPLLFSQMPSAPAVERTEMSGVPDNVLARLKSKPIFSDALTMETRRLKKEHGDVLRGASDSQIEKLAAANLIHNYGSSDGNELPTPDFTVADHLDKRRHEAISESNAAEGLQLRRQASSRADEALKLRKEAKDKESIDPYNIASGWISNTLQKGTPAANMVQMHTKQYQGNTVVDLNGIAGKGFFKDPETGGPIKVLGFTNPNTLKKGYLIQYYRKATEKEQKAGKGNYIRMEGKNKTVHDDDLYRFHTSIAAQMQTGSKKDNYDETANSADDLLDETTE